MKKLRNILILIGVIFFANYIIHLPMCVEDYISKDSGIYSSQNMCRQSTLTRNTAKEIMSAPTIKIYILPEKANYIFDITNIFFTIINIPVYIWQFARANINLNMPIYRTVSDL